MQLNKPTFLERRKQVTNIQLEALESAYQARKTLRKMEDITGRDLSNLSVSSQTLTQNTTTETPLSL
jgi:hypothetical protein